METPCGVIATIATRLSRGGLQSLLTGNAGWFCEADAMSVLCADAELPQAPGFGRRLGQHLCSSFGDFRMKLIDALDDQIRHVRVVPQLACWLLASTFAKHDLERIPRQKTPAIRTFAEIPPKSEDVDIKPRGCLQIAHGKNA